MKHVTLKLTQNLVVTDGLHLYTLCYFYCIGLPIESWDNAFGFLAITLIHCWPFSATISTQIRLERPSGFVSTKPCSKARGSQLAIKHDTKAWKWWRFVQSWCSFLASLAFATWRKTEWIYCWPQGKSHLTTFQHVLKKKFQLWKTTLSFFIF